MSRERIKREAKRLQKLLPDFVNDYSAPYPLSACQELAARAAGFKDYHAVPKDDVENDLRRDIAAIRSQLDVAIASALARGPQQLDAVDWSTWLALVEVHESMHARDDVFVFPGLAATTAARLHMNPMDLDAIVIAVQLQNYKTFSEAEPIVAQAMDHLLKANMVFDEIDEEETHFFDEALAVIEPKAAVYHFAAYLMMAAIEQDNPEKAAHACQMALMIDQRGDESELLNPGICCALEADDLKLAVQVYAALFGEVTVPLETITTGAATDSSAGVPFERSEAGIVELLLGLETRDWDVPPHVYANAAAIHALATANPDRHAFSDVVSKMIVPETGISSEFVRSQGNLLLAAARYIARRPQVLEKLAKLLRGRPKLH